MKPLCLWHHKTYIVSIRSRSIDKWLLYVLFLGSKLIPLYQNHTHNKDHQMLLDSFNSIHSSYNFEAFKNTWNLIKQLSKLNMQALSAILTRFWPPYIFQKCRKVLWKYSLLLTMYHQNVHNNAKVIIVNYLIAVAHILLYLHTNNKGWNDVWWQTIHLFEIYQLIKPTDTFTPLTSHLDFWPPNYPQGFLWFPNYPHVQTNTPGLFTWAPVQ